MFRTITSTMACFGFVLLTACGGGGNNSTTTPVASTKTFDLKTTYANFLQTTVSRGFSIAGSINGLSVTGGGTATLGALQASTFLGSPALVRTQTITGNISANGQTVPYGASSQAYYDSNYNPLGSSNTGFSVVESRTSLPTAAKINDAGIWMKMTNYPSSAKAFITGSTTVSYSIGADSESTALLTLITTEQDTSGKHVSSITSTYRISSNNSVIPIAESNLSTGISVTLTYK
ncbi:MAG: hypothetical protein KA173_08080 [Rhodoferax sp.]|nr:hypothetical protein [Rhodoferax sp.]